MGEYTDFSEALCLLKLIWQYPEFKHKSCHHHYSSAGLLSSSDVSNIAPLWSHGINKHMRYGVNLFYFKFYCPGTLHFLTWASTCLRLQWPLNLSEASRLIWTSCIMPTPSHRPSAPPSSGKIVTEGSLAWTRLTFDMYGQLSGQTYHSIPFVAFSIA